MIVATKMLPEVEKVLQKLDENGKDDRAKYENDLGIMMIFALRVFWKGFVVATSHIW